MSLQLKKIDTFKGRPGPVILAVLDGVGIGKQDDSDGVYLAKTPHLDKLKKSPFYTQLKAHGTAVGMPTDDDMGNSEVGHNTLGAGRVADQGAKLVKKSIESGEAFKTDTWQNLVAQVKKNKSVFHLMGLLSDGNVHSHIDLVIAMIRQLKSEGVTRVRLHILLDGRDVFEKSALTYIEKMEKVLHEINGDSAYDYRIASGGGRMTTTMDRYNAEWDMVERGWQAHVLGVARPFTSAREAVQTMYDEDPKITDQYLGSFTIVENDKPVGSIQDGDSVVFFNFRGDRAIEMSMAFDMGEAFDRFDRQRQPKVMYAGMMQYDGDMNLPKNYLVPPPKIKNPVGYYMCANDITTFAISETQKYGHVTYFWNGNKSGYVDESKEKYIEIPSDKIQFDKAPKMKAYEITDKVIELIRSGKYKFGRINYPNGDMVGHTGVPEAIITSIEATDECLGKLIDEITKAKGVLVVVADHGNADEMFTVKKGEKKVSTAHSLNPVPCAIVDPLFNGEYSMANIKEPGLANVAATLLNLCGFQQPDDYEPSLIQFD